MRDRQTDRSIEIDRQADRQTERDRQTDRSIEIDRQTGRQTDRERDKKNYIILQ